VGFGEQVLNEWYTDDVKQIMLSVRDCPITIARSATGTGKSHSAARLALWFYLTQDNAQVYTMAAPPEDNLRRILWGEMGNLILKHKDSLLRGHTHSDLALGYPGDALRFLRGLTIPSTGSPAEKESKFSGKHAPNMLFIVDEGDAVIEEVYRGIDGCMSGGIRIRLLIMFNPRNDSGYVARLEREGRANVVEMSAFRHPNVISGGHKIPGAVSREVTARRIHDWTLPLGPTERPDAECFEVPEYLIGYEALSTSGNRTYPPLIAGWRRIVEPQFSYKVLGQYPAAGDGQLINRAWINAARARYDAYVAEFGLVPPEAVIPVGGLDVSEGLSRDFNALCLRYGGFIMPIQAWKGIDVLETADKAAALFKQAKGSMICVDGTGVGAGVVPEMDRQGLMGRAHSVKLNNRPTFEVEMGKFRHIRDQMYWMMREWLRNDSGAMLPPDRILIEELMTPTYRNQGGYLEVMRKDEMISRLGRSPDRMEALMLTFYNEAVESEQRGGALHRAMYNYRGV